LFFAVFSLEQPSQKPSKQLSQTQINTTLILMAI
jgi:hypothetical protein